MKSLFTSLLVLLSISSFSQKVSYDSALACVHYIDKNANGKFEKAWSIDKHYYDTTYTTPGTVIWRLSSRNESGYDCAIIGDTALYTTYDTLNFDGKGTYVESGDKILSRNTILRVTSHYLRKCQVHHKLVTKSGVEIDKTKYYMIIRQKDFQK